MTRLPECYFRMTVCRLRPFFRPIFRFQKGFVGIKLIFSDFWFGLGNFRTTELEFKLSN